MGLLKRIIGPYDSFLFRSAARPYYRLHPAPSEGLVAKYDKAVRWLRDVADGRVGLGLDGDFKPPVEDARRLGSVTLMI